MTELPPAIRPVRTDEARRIGALAVAIVALGVSSIISLVVVALPGRAVPTDEFGAVVERSFSGVAEAEVEAAVEQRPVEEVAPAPAVIPAAPAPAPVVGPPSRRGSLPVGKGMWIWLPEHSEGGHVTGVVARAKAVGLTHIYVRTGSSRMGFYAQNYLNHLLPHAHANGIKVYGWDFPYFDNWAADVMRAVEAINYTTPDGHRLDGFNADIETWREGVNVNTFTAFEYGRHLRKWVGPAYPLIATVPRPNPALTSYPYAHVVSSFDAIAPMVYWHGRDPGADVANAIAYLSQFGKPIMPVGQAYDASGEGGPPGVPPRWQILKFMEHAEAHGAVSVSFWSWGHATQESWDAIRDSSWFVMPEGDPNGWSPGLIKRYQTLLRYLGFNASLTGVWDAESAAALGAYQLEAGLDPTGVIDTATHTMMFKPFAPPLQPQQ
jgi:hypothetical protein